MNLRKSRVRFKRTLARIERKRLKHSLKVQLQKDIEEIILQSHKLAEYKFWNLRR